MSVLVFLKLVRLPNLLIANLTMFFVGVFLGQRGMFVLDKTSFWMFLLVMVTTTSIMGAGYVINDCLDVRADKINKPEKVIVSDLISSKKAQLIYGLMNCFALAGIVVIFMLTQNLVLCLILVSCILILFTYSKWLQHTFLIGNILVGLLCTLLFWIIPLALVFPYDFLHSSYAGLWYISAFAFVTTIVREIVKDVEDHDGDLLEASRTLALLFSKKGIRVLLTILLLFIFSLLSYLLISFLHLRNIFVTVYMLLLLCSSIYLLIKILAAKDKSDFSTLQKHIKYFIVQGLFLLPLWPETHP